MISRGVKTVECIDLSNIKDADIASYYLGVSRIPCVISSPLRVDKNPSFALYSKDGVKVGFLDYSTKEYGSIISLLMQMWHCNYYDAIAKIANDLQNSNLQTSITPSTKKGHISAYSKIEELKCKTREWRDYDIEYWKSYGISLKWLKFADVYPISHKIIVKNGSHIVYGADKYAYAYVEFKENKTTLKIYQPFNKYGYKWANSHDKSVISLWTKIPHKGDKVCICSSLKDALCLWANTNIPAIAVQGEGYNISNTAITQLKERYSKIFILFDNDSPGRINGQRLSELTGFTNIVLPSFEGGKDVSDLMKLYGKSIFLETIIPLFNN